MPVDRGAIDAQLREIGEGEGWWEKREFRDLPHILYADERIRGIVEGKLLGPRRPRVAPAGRWLVVATDQRLICLRQDRFARKQVDIASDQIAGVRQSSRLRSFQITIETSLRRYRIRIPKADAFRFARAFAPLVPQPSAQGLPRGAEPLPDASFVPSGVVGIFARLSAPEHATRGQVERLEVTVERLRDDVERLQQQVAFLEDLLQKRTDEAFLPRSSADV